MSEQICLLKFTAKPYINRAAGSVVGPLGFEPRIAYAPGMYPEPC
jgi:hypothetical protein